MYPGFSAKSKLGVLADKSGICGGFVSALLELIADGYSSGKHQASGEACNV